VMHEGDVSDKVADEVHEAVRERPWLETVAQLGWVAKGMVYLLFGATATQIARQEQSDDEASPNGALNRVMEQPGGRVLLLVMGVGLVLYCLWRVLSVAVIRKNDVSGWAHRIGYSFSAAFYGVLAFTAFRTVMRGSKSKKSNTVEKLSRSLLDTTWGRALVLIGGVVTIAIGLYFIVRKGILRSFVDDLRGVDESDDEALDWTIIVAGVAGWIGRGVVTVLVGFLVAKAAYSYDPKDARGFDGALRKAATSSTGEIFVWISAVGLMLYGAFCVFSHRYRHIEDNS
jgi:Domain of Unknown Function (DUF1206)